MTEAAGNVGRRDASYVAVVKGKQNIQQMLTLSMVAMVLYQRVGRVSIYVRWDDMDTPIT